MRTRCAFLAIVFLAAASATAPTLSADQGSGAAKVTYVSGSSVYIDAGSEDGLAVDDLVELVRDGATVAKLKVAYVTAHRATCSPDGAVPEIKIGDAVRFARRERSASDAAAAATPPAAPKDAPASRSGESAFRRAGMRGRVGLRYLWVKDHSGIAEDFSQPSLDLVLAGTQIGGAPVDVNIDVRARRTYRTVTGGTSSDYGANHVYQANVAWRGGGFRLAAGRQVAPTLAVTSLFDGIVAEYRRNGWSAGVLAGTQPDPATYAFASDVRQYGAYTGYATDPAKSTRWHFGFGAISSTENGEVNRDFVYVEARVTHPVVGVYLQQQVDINRGWRKDAEGSTFTPSATFLMIHVRAATAWSLDGGYDSRRNVLLYPDLVTPVTAFDDATRQGYWLGATWRPRGRWLVGVDGRRSAGGTLGTATSYTLRLGAMNMTKAQIDVQARGTRYTGTNLDGYLASVSGAIALGSRVRLDLHGGERQDTWLPSTIGTAAIDWLGTMLDVIIGRSAYFNVSFDRTRGGEEDNDQVYAAFSWRF